MNRFVLKEQIDETAAASLEAALSIRAETARALCIRGITTAAQAETYIRPSFSDLHDPLLLPDMQPALERIRRAIQSHERICIYGDYDADGVCATSILYLQLRAMGADVECFVPSRHEDGYGMHTHTVELLCENGVDLIITVDNGITAIDEIALCTEYGVDVIVTDHHIPRETLPACCAVVAASRTDSAYPYGELCGAGIAYKLACALAEQTLSNELLGLAAVATMADVVPLDGENRVIVQLGLPYAAQNLGLCALLRTAGQTGELDAQALAFLLAPRLNAAGRMGDASRAISLLVSKSDYEAQRLSESLQEDNTRRRADETKVLHDIYERFSEQELRSRKAIVVFGAGWNVGVLGIAASRLCEQLYRPVILFTEHKEYWTGSGRSMPGIHLHDSLLPFSDRFERFGGHARAVGVTIEPSRFEKFVSDYTAYMERTYAEEVFVPTYTYEQTLRLSSLSVELVEELKLLAPFGEGNPIPRFLLQDVALRDSRKIGKNGEHLDAVASQGETSVRLVGFRQGGLADRLPKTARCDLVCTLQNNTFRGNTKPELLLIACNTAEKMGDDQPDHENIPKIIGAILQEVRYNKMVNCDILCDLFLRLECMGAMDAKEFTLEQMRALYRRLRRRLLENAEFFACEEPPLNVLFALSVFLELGFFSVDPDSGTIREAENRAGRSLSESRLYTAILAISK